MLRADYILQKQTHGLRESMVGGTIHCSITEKLIAETKQNNFWRCDCELSKESILLKNVIEKAVFAWHK